MNRKIIRLKEVAELTSIPLGTLRYYRVAGVGGPPTWILANRVVAYEDEIVDWLDAQRAAAG